MRKGKWRKDIDFEDNENLPECEECELPLGQCFCDTGEDEDEEKLYL